MHFENNASYIELRKIVEIEFLLLYCSLKKKTFFSVHLRKAKCINCLNLLLIKCQSIHNQKAVKVP